MKPALIDTHVHIDDCQFDPDREKVIQRATDASVTGMVIPAVCAAHWPRIQRIANAYPHLFPTIGLHPLHTAEHTKEHLQCMEAELARQRFVAIGECGLDTFLPDHNIELQLEYFVAQLQLARQYKLPVIIHARKTVEQVILLLRTHGPEKGVVHSYNGSLQQAHRLIDLGYSLGFGGPITYPRARKLRALVTSLPMENMILETDAPFQPIHDQPSARNEPANIQSVLTTFSQLRKAPAADIALASNQNAIRLFELADDRLIANPGQ